MSELPEPKRRRVAPAVTDPMAPSTPAPPPVQPAAPAVAPAPAAAAPRVKAASKAVSPANGPVTTTRRTATVQLATRISTEADVQLHELVAARDTTIRDTIEELIASAWRKEARR